MKTSTLLRRARRYLWDGNSCLYQYPLRYRCLCIAVERAAHKGAHYRNIPVCVEIQRRLGGHPTLEKWLLSKDVVLHYKTDEPAIQAHRKQWLNMLIAEYEAKGD